MLLDKVLLKMKMASPPLRDDASVKAPQDECGNSESLLAFTRAMVEFLLDSSVRNADTFVVGRTSPSTSYRRYTPLLTSRFIALSEQLSTSKVRLSRCFERVPIRLLPSQQALDDGSSPVPSAIARPSPSAGVFGKPAIALRRR